MAGITVAPGIDVEPEALDRLEAHHYLPGETVRVDPSTVFVSETREQAAVRHAAFADRVLTVAETRLDRSPDGKGEILQYVFEGLEGLHNARAFMDARGYDHLYGTLIHRDGASWFVPFEEEKPRPRAAAPFRPFARPAAPAPASGEKVYAPSGPARLLRPELSRSARHCFGFDGEGGASFLESNEAEPSIGEFVVMPEGDGTWTLSFSPWMTRASDDEVARSEAAIRLAAPSRAPGM